MRRHARKCLVVVEAKQSGVVLNLLAFKVKGAFRTGTAVEVYVACSACAQAGISFYHSYMYIFHINHVSSKDEIKTWGPLALSGPASLRSTSAHAHFDDDRKGKRDRRPQEGCCRAQSQACKRKLVIESAKPRC